MNVLENNKLLTDFLGGYEIDEYEDFNTDWNCIMKVVDKIENLGSSEVMDRKIYSRFEIYGNHIQLDWRRNNQDLLRLEVCQKQMLTHKGYSCKEYKRIDIEKNTTRMEALYIACIEFVKWFNLQNIK